MQPKIGFIGLGSMGSAMVYRLQDLHYDITIKGNINRQAIEEALSRGATESNSCQNLASQVDVLMLCLDTSENVESCIYGEDGILSGVKQETVVIDFGTSLPSSTIKIGKDLASKGAHYLDAPLGRTPVQARVGKLNIMGAGDEKIFQSVLPILNDLGENVFFLGPLGTGHKIKLLNNFFAMTVACSMAEVFATASVAEVPLENVYKAMSAGPLHSGMMDFIRNYAIDGEINLSFSISNANKDVGYYAQMATDLGIESKMSVAAKNALSEAISGGYGDQFVPQITDFFRKSHL